MRALIVTFALLVIGCGGNKTPTAPPPPPPPQPAQISGSWSGTLESTTYVPLAVFVTLSQTTGAVSGTWSASTGSSGIAGNITGTVDPSSFTGTITLSINQSAGCSASFNGPAATNSSTLNWSSAGFTGNCQLSSGNPIAPRFVLQRR